LDECEENTKFQRNFAGIFVLSTSNLEVLLVH